MSSCWPIGSVVVIKDNHDMINNYWKKYYLNKVFLVTDGEKRSTTGPIVDRGDGYVYASKEHFHLHVDPSSFYD